MEGKNIRLMFMNLQTATQGVSTVFTAPSAGCATENNNKNNASAVPTSSHGTDAEGSRHNGIDDDTDDANEETALLSKSSNSISYSSTATNCRVGHDLFSGVLEVTVPVSMEDTSSGSASVTTIRKIRHVLQSLWAGNPGYKITVLPIIQVKKIFFILLECIE